MTQTLTLVGALLVVLLLNAAMVAYYARSGGVAPDERVRGAEPAAASTGDGAPSPEGTAPPLEADGPTVDCRRCGTRNEERYRFCRWCVAPLGNGDAPDHSAATVSGRAF